VSHIVFRSVAGYVSVNLIPVECRSNRSRSVIVTTALVVFLQCRSRAFFDNLRTGTPFTCVLGLFSDRNGVL